MTEGYAPVAQYTFRRSVLEGERTYTLYPDRIEVAEGELPLRRYLLNEVRVVHIKYEHTKQRGYYQCFIRTPDTRLALRHVHWKGAGNFEDRRATYTPFVKALLGELSRFPGVQFKAGSMGNFIAAMIGIPLMTALGVLALSRGLEGRAALAGFMVFLCLVMLRPSRPRRLDPLAPPEDLLPS